MKYPVIVKWSDAIEAFFEREHIYLMHPTRVRGVYKAGDEIRINGPVSVERYGTLVRNHFFSVGAFSYANTHLPFDVQIGRYCSIAPRVEVMGAQHPTSRFTTSPITYLPRWVGFAQSEFSQPWAVEHFEENLAAPIIGNDVWIGQDVLLKRGINIGNGACIAGGSIVTKDVEPYAIVGGVPAKLIRYRFQEHQRSRLLSTAWWQYRFVDLPQGDFSDIDRFLDRLDEKVGSGLRPWEPGKIELAEALGAIR